MRIYFLLLTSLYFLAHFWLPLNRGIFWDDWVWVPNPEEGLRAIWELGTPFLGLVSNTLLSLENGIYLFKFFIFLNYLFVVLGSFFILTRHRLLSKVDAFALCSLIAVLPVNNAKVTLCTGNYSTSLMLFTGATVLLLENKFWTKLLAIPLFLISFFTNSLLVFFVVPILLHYYVLYGFNIKFKEYLKQMWIFILLPPTFWIYKKLFLPVHGLYENYNKISLDEFFFNLTNWKIALANATVTPFFYLFDVAHVRLYSLTILMIGLSLLISYLISRKNKFLPIVLGLILFVIATFPYMTVHKLPLFYTWESRHQLLMPFGIALIFFGLAQQLGSVFKGSSRAHLYIIGVIVILGLATQWKLYVGFQRDWIKQLGLVEALKDNATIRDHSTFEMLDVSPHWNAPGLIKAFFNYNGLMSIAFGNQTRFAGNAVEIEEFIKKPKDLQLILDHASRYNMKDYKPTPVQYKVQYKINAEKNWPELVKTLYWEWTNKTAFENYLKNLVTIETFKQ